MFFELFQALVYGIVQGIAEFLPISSTAHLILLPYFFHWDDPGLAFDVFLHLGTLLAIIIYFARDWVKIFKDFFARKSNLFGYIIISMIPAAIVGYFLESRIETVFRSVLVVASSLIIFSAVMYVADRYFRHLKELKNMNWWKSLIIGVAQSIALIPGVSRSGSTMTMGMFLGFKRDAAARFAFLIATPIMIGATLFKVKDLFSIPASELFNGFGLVPAIFGFLVALISGYLAIKYLLKYLSHGTFLPFIAYRIALALIILIFYFLIR